MSYNNHRKRKARSAHAHRPESIPHRKSSPDRDAPEYQFLSHHEPYQRQAYSEVENEPDPLRLLYIEAHEADIVHGPDAVESARALEVVEYRVAVDGTVEVAPSIGASLIQWRGSDPTAVGSHSVATDGDVIPAVGETCSAVWVDRYDARLLLDPSTALPHIPTDEHEVPPASPSGWSDIPSDAEDMFFFTPAEVADVHREKRRRLLERTREERLQARLEEDGVTSPPPDTDVWGGSDEEPDPAQTALMHRTAAHLLASPNRAQLELRILANHGADRRFAFLRGRWRRAWALAQAKARVAKADAERPPPLAGLGIVAGYGSDSDGDGEDGTTGTGPAPPEERPSSAGAEPEPEPEPRLALEQTGGSADLEDVSKEAKRKRLREWMERRRAEKDGE